MTTGFSLRSRISSYALDVFWRWGRRWGTTPIDSRDPTTLLSSVPSCAATADQIYCLRTILRKWPTWANGHLQLAERALIIDDIACAYASAHAALSCRGDQKSIKEGAWFVLGRCYLRRGVTDQALSFLDRASALKGRETEVHEEIAAAWLLQGNRQESQRILEALPQTELSPAGAAALQFLRAKSVDDVV